MAAFTLLFTSVTEPSSAENIPGYLNTFTVGIGPSPSLVFSSWCGVGIYSVFVLLARRPCLSKWCLHLSIIIYSSCSTFLLVSHKARDHLQIALTPVVYFQVHMPEHPWVLRKGGDWALSLDGGLPLSWSNQCTHLLSVIRSGCPFAWPWCRPRAYSSGTLVSSCSTRLILPELYRI